jgi:hypothetical protein
MALRRLGPLLLAVLLAVGLLAAPPSVSEVRAATPNLTIVTSARYDVLPSRNRVKVTVDMTLRNRMKDTATHRYYFDRAFLAVLPAGSAFKLSSSGVRPSVAVSRKTKDYTLLRFNLGRRLFSGKTAKYRLTFELRDKGGSADRDLRIGDSLVTFPVWAYATDSTPGSSVTVVFPEGYTIDVQGSELPKPTVDENGRTIYRSGTLDRPLGFFAYFVGDRRGAYADRAVETAVHDEPVEVLVRSWREDAPWGERVAGLFERGLPRLGERIGLPWPRDGGLVVQEAVTRSTGGYAGLFDPTRGHVDVAYNADDFVALHEAAHAWFNGDLLTDRWALEAFASYYALEVAADLEVKARGEELTEALLASKIPLNSWGPIGREELDVEDYAYAATLELARQIAERAGDDGLQAVWAAADGREGAYQPPEDSAGATTGSGTEGGTPKAAEPERVGGPPDWRGLLDLFEERTDAEYVDLWREWVARPDDLPLLDARAAARDRYDQVLGEADGWALPRPIRDALRAWQFEAATDLLDEAATILEGRDAIDRAAADAGLTPPDSLRTAFEGDDLFADATVEIEAQVLTIDRYEEAVAARPADPDLITQLGLWEETPELDLEAAATAYAAGDLEASARASEAALGTWLGAANVGQGRALIIASVAVGILLALLFAIAALLQRRRNRRRATVVPAIDDVPA